ncbi:hypothetical protein P153DRAFT_329801 [Dothidotthia symphoricarpi CBS 119687]|uniref:DUF4238 domain-containing protein n=1 Tax=Dothidotthia symphoricarpi CBS 119687 TaxID=1392245 RepID=A0A6A6AVR0_9PLEO|nr:uncharacterized protein P153DRAFT_329801 [Dothidotthia symphoricarpi CBS 119687]KAF2134927.1 hypothetical protein P153DRAFT_329801 [Dothidotthia symphoricarpi CBS 119687]
MAATQGSQTQYHHFIPQFILKNFSHRYAPPQLNSRSTSGRKARNTKTKLYRGSPVLNILDLEGKVPQLNESPVKRTFGLLNMYQDLSNVSDFNYLEKEIGKLESRVSVLIAGIRDALGSGKGDYSMSRPERDMLRKFMFIMKYRGPGFYRRFHGDKSGNYKQDDTDKFKAYMQEKGYQKPVDVWFQSIKTILNLEMDLDGSWQKQLLRDIYPSDAMWFIMHTEWYFLAFCTPSDPNDEFILTENCYNIHEGPNSTALNPNTGEYDVVCWTSYHEFSPITPKLMFILRSCTLPNAEEDRSESIKEWRTNMYEMSRSQHSNPATAISTLEDLPIRKPQNSYSRITPQGIRLLPGEDGSRRSNHRFTFPFCKIDTDQVHRINYVMLENAHRTMAISYKSAPSLMRSIKHYLELPADRSCKHIYRQDTDGRLVYLRKLETIVRNFGIDVNMVYREVPGVNEQECLKKEALDQLEKEMLEYIPQQPPEFMIPYKKLGGTRETFITDMYQAEKMRFLRIKVDVCTRGFRETIREKIRDNLRDIFCQLPTRRFWIYLKSLRVMSLSSPETFEEQFASMDNMQGPEDVIVKATHVVRPECLGLLLHFTVMQDIQHRLNPGLGPSSDFSLDDIGFLRLRKITNLTFSSVGSICNCGIKRVEEIAITILNMARATQMYKPYMNPVWSNDENIELFVRTSVRGQMSKSLSDQLDSQVLEELSDVLFNIVYPTYTKILKS